MVELESTVDFFLSVGKQSFDAPQWDCELVHTCCAKHREEKKVTGSDSTAS